MHSVSWLRIEIPHKPSSAFLTRAFSIQVSTVSNMSTNRLFCPTKHHRTSHGSALFKHVLLVFVGILTGAMFDYGYLRTLILAGCFGVVFGMMTSLCTTYWQVVFAQSVRMRLSFCALRRHPSFVFLNAKSAGARSRSEWE